MESLFLCCLCQLGPDRDAMLQCIEPSMGSIAMPLIVWLIDTIVSRCRQEAQRLRGFEDDGIAQEQEDSPIAASSQRTLTPQLLTFQHLCRSSHAGAPWHIQQGPPWG